MGDALNNERFGFESDLHIGIEIVGTKFSSTSIRVKRDWKMQLKEQQDNVDIKKTTIKSIRDIGVAYGNGQPKAITYNVSGWW